MIWINEKTRKTMRLYAAALLEVCGPAGVDPVEVLTETDDYRKLLRSIDMAEFLVGTFHGVSLAAGVSLRQVWTHVAEGLPVPARKGKAKAKSKALVRT